ncbi:MAG: M28 family peptidase [Sphingomonadales bacterium]|nr:M28 family peptidase [Sphingomonadales bacterium]
MKTGHMLTAAGALCALAFATPLCAQASSSEPVSEAELRETISVLASDEYGGRKPGTGGETQTLAYIAHAFHDAGLGGGAKDASRWYQPVDLERAVPSPGSFVVMANGVPVTLASDEVVVTAEAANSSLAALPIVFSGYGVDGEGQAIGEVAGALAVMMGSEPPYEPGSAELKNYNRRMAALFDAGAKAVLVVLDSETPFAMVKSYLARGTTRLAGATKRPDRVRASASEAYAAQLFAAADRDYAALSAAAKADDFGGTPLGVTADLATANRTEAFRSYNVIAKLGGTDPAAGAVFFTGHWDHLGTCLPEGAEDRICNGAVDNASGIAVLIATAKRLATMGPFDRDIYFVATTAEEMGLLGGYALAEDPPVPLSDIVIALNVDTVAIADRGAKVAIIGRGKTDLEDEVEHVARSIGRTVDESDEANAFIQRQDGWTLLQKGVPALMVGGSFSDQALLGKFLAGPYHKHDDELTDAVPLGGAAEDADLHVALGAYFADSDRYPGKGRE